MKPNTVDSPITPEMMKQAFDEIGANCDGPAGCIHGEALAANADAIEECIAESQEHYEQANLGKHGLSMELQLLVSGIHVGYRLAQLELGTYDKSKVN